MTYTNTETPPTTEPAWVVAYRSLTCAIDDKELRSRDQTHGYPDGPLLDGKTAIDAVVLRRNERFGLEARRFVFQVRDTDEEASEAFAGLIRWHREQRGAQESHDPLSWALTKLHSLVPDALVLRNVMLASRRRGQSLWVAYLNELTGEVAYGSVEDNVLASLIDMVRKAPPHLDLLRQFLTTRGMALGSTLEEFLFLRQPQLPDEYLNGNVEHGIGTTTNPNVMASSSRSATNILGSVVDPAHAANT